MRGKGRSLHGAVGLRVAEQHAAVRGNKLRGELFGEPVGQLLLGGEKRAARRADAEQHASRAVWLFARLRVFAVAEIGGTQRYPPQKRLDSFRAVRPVGKEIIDGGLGVCNRDQHAAAAVVAVIAHDARRGRGHTGADDLVKQEIIRVADHLYPLASA